jgi:hypothetical protein
MNIEQNNKLLAEFLGQIKIPYEFPRFGYIKINGDWSDTFFTITEAANKLGLNSSHITSVCKGKRRSTGGFLWRYKI